MSDDNIEDRFKIHLSLPFILIFTSCMLVTISLLQLATTLAKNITTEVNALIDKGNALGNLGNHTGAIQYFDKAILFNICECGSDIYYYSTQPPSKASLP